MHCSLLVNGNTLTNESLL